MDSANSDADRPANRQGPSEGPHPAHSDADGGPASSSQPPSATGTSTPGSGARSSVRRSGWRYTFSSLAVPSFRLLWLAMLFRGACLGMEHIARGFLVYEITGSAKILGLVSAASVVPVLFLALFSGAIADRLDRKHLIQMAQATSTTEPGL